MTLKTCKDCIHGAICTICDYDDVLNVNDYCRYFKDKADVVEVVRCKDCVEWDAEDLECSHWYGMRKNCYCSYGIRKEGVDIVNQSDF